MELTPLVSVVMITYGHENYIRDAINGVFLQKTNFLVELIIANDCSPDNTDEVVKNLIKNPPKNIIVNYIKHDKNLGMNDNFSFAYQQAKGKYIAICEGDDYWTYENKLQKQVDFLEQNPDFSICCHNFRILENDTLKEQTFLNVKNDIMDIVDLSKRNTVPTPTAVFKNIKISFPKWMKDAPLSDLVVFLKIAETGKIKFLNEKWAVYRKGVGVWRKNGKDYIKLINLYENLINDYQHIPKVQNNLLISKKKYIKAYLYNLRLFEILNNKYFKTLPFFDKIKILIKKLLK